jgi:hypothetical protein
VGLLDQPTQIPLIQEIKQEDEKITLPKLDFDDQQ